MSLDANQEKRLLFVLLVLGLLSLLPNLGLYEFKNEESLRTLLAFEMAHSGDYAQPTFLGEPYFEKPPLFNWLTLLSARLVGWGELTVRTVSVVSTALTCLLILGFVRRHLGDTRLGLLAALVYLSFPNVLFFYGFVGEIDSTFTLFLLALLALLYEAVTAERMGLLPLAGLVAGLAFMLKGFAAFAYFGLFYLSFVLFRRDWRLLIHPRFVIGGLLALVMAMVWIDQTVDPAVSLDRLIWESAKRVDKSLDAGAFFGHLVRFPLETLVNLLPVGGFVAYAVYSRHRSGAAGPLLPAAAAFLVLAAGLNYLLYLLAAGSRVRYVLPILPLLAIPFAYVLDRYLPARGRAVLLYTLAGIVALRFAMGLVVIPIAAEHKENSPRDFARDIMSTIDLSRPLACDCKGEKAICLYIALREGRVIRTSALEPDWEYNISCEAIPGSRLLKTYPREETVYLYQR